MVTLEIKSKVDCLSEEDRASLASYILHGFEPPEYDVSDADVTSRVQELYSGEAYEIDHDALVRGLDLRK